MKQAQRNKKGYYNINGNDYPSVTTILNMLSKPALYYWYGKHGTAKCNEILKESQEIGTSLHEFIHHNLFKIKALSKEIPEKTKNAFENFKLFKKDYSLKPYKGELTVYSSQHKYAGQLDLLAVVTDEGIQKRVMIDWKSSSSIYDSHELQLQAYYHALEELWYASAEEKNLPEELWIIRLDKTKNIRYNRDIKKFKVDKESFEAFLSLLNVFQWTKKEKTNDKN